MLRRIAVSTFVFFLFAAVFALSNFLNPVSEAATLPPDFEDALVAGVGAPTALAFTPDGRLLITTQQGQVRVFQNNTLLTAPAVNLNARLCTNSERGLLGIAVDPNFASNRYVYLYYSLKKNAACDGTTVNRVARFVLADNNTINTASETVLIDNIHSPAGNHNGGDLHFGKDGLLYISVGDGGCDYAGNSGCAGANDAARDRHVMLGKILRITRDGAIPAGNPYQGAGTGRCNVTGSTTSGNWCQETFASGLRNPFRISFDSNASGTRFFINDVGQNAWEEIDEGLIGADYGWNVREGHCANGSTTNCGAPPAGLTNPIFDYPRGCVAGSVSGNSITGGAFVPNDVWSSAYDNSYLFGEYVCGKIFKLTPNGSGGYTASEFVTGLGNSSAVAMIFGPYQSTKALYYTTYANGGQVRRIRYTGTTNRDPVAEVFANPTTGAAPLDVQFNASTSSDPDDDPLTFSWNFGDGTTGTGAMPVHRYAAIGTYNPVVTVSDGRGGSATATIRIDVGNTAPQPTITSPTASQLFRVGETITLTGSAFDAQDGNLPDNRLTWEVLLHHNDDHTHPYLSPTVGNNITFTAPAPEDLQAATGSFLEIRLTATDFNGLSQTIVRNFQPRKVNITFATQPGGLNLTVNGTTVTGSTTVVSWDNYQLNVNAPNQTVGGQQYTFSSWSDGGAAAHTITTPATAATYTATFQTSGGGGTLPSGWTSQDIGSVGQTGSASFANGTWTLQGSGADIWNEADGFRFAYKTLTGDGQITARVASVGNTDEWAKAGVMIRQSLTANSSHAMVVVTSGNGVAFQSRASAGASSAHTSGANVVAPYWVRLVRSGSTLTAYQSADGSLWTQIGSQTINFTGDVYIGLAVTAHNNSALNTSVFSNVSTSNTGGGGLPSGWTSQDIGSVGQTGSASFANGTWTLQGSGDDIWNAADAFRFAYRTLTGDGQITARVESVGSTDSWAKAGVMIRQSLTANSPHAMVVVTSGNGVAFQSRASAGASSAHTSGANVVAPYWVRLVRSGSTLTAYQSADGSVWTQIGSQTINFTGDVYIGLAVTAHNNSALNNSTFSNVNVTANASGGLNGEYFDNPNFTNLVTTRRDATVNFDWGTGTPTGTALTGPDTFSVRWTGQVTAPVTGSYTFTTTSDDGVRLWVNNQLLINNWTDHSPTDNSGVINLTANTAYDIRMEFYENGGGAVAKLFWSYPGSTRQIIPSGRLSANATFAAAFPTDCKRVIFGCDRNKALSALTGADWSGWLHSKEAKANGINTDSFVLPEPFIKRATER